MESSNVFEEKDWDLYGLSHWWLVGFIFSVSTKRLRADGSASACIASIIRLYFSAQLSTSEDVNYYVGLMGLWTLPEMASAFLAMCLPVFPKFFRSLKRPYSFSWITIAQRYLFRSPGTASNKPSLDNLVLPTYQPKKSALWPTKQDSPVYIPTRFETGNLHIMRSTQIPTINQPGDAGTQSFTKGVSTGW